MPEVYAKVKAEQEEAKNQPCNCIKCKLSRAIGIEISLEIQKDSESDSNQADQGGQADQASQGKQGCQGCGKCEKAAAATTETEKAA